MSVRIKVNESGIEQTIEHNFNNARSVICSQILRDCNEFCKEDTGMLILSSLIHSKLNEGLLIWNTPYAARQYYEIQTANPSPNHNATWRWVEVAKQRYFSRWVRQADEYVRKYGK